MSFRSRPEILAFVNDLFDAVEKAADRPDRFRYDDGDRFPLDEAIGGSTQPPAGASMNSAGQLSLRLDDEGPDANPCLGLIVGDSITGFDRFKMGAFDLILMDCNIPEMDGFETTRRIRGVEAARKVKTPISIIAITASISEEDRKKCFECGMNAFLAKPFRKEDLVSLLNEVIGAHTS